MRRTTLALALALASGLALNVPTAAFADTTTGNVDVSATVVSYATLTTNAIAFGNYQATAVNTSSSLAVTASNGTPYVVTLSAGSSTAATARSMTSTTGTDKLNYAVYKEPNRINNWGATANTGVSGTGTGSAQTIPMYATIPAGQNAKPGTYSDTLVATVTY